MIVIAGLPSSGNHLVFTHVRRGVEAKYSSDTVVGVTREAVQIWHGDNVSPNITRPEGERLVFVIPVRNEAVRKLSVHKRVSHSARVMMPLDDPTMRSNVVRLIATSDAPWYGVSYEGLVADPQRAGRDLFEWLELPWVDWPNGGTRHSGPPFDANAAYHVSLDTMSRATNDPYTEGPFQ